MKVRFYCDIYPGSYPRHDLFAMTTPYNGKGANATRLAFDVEIPDRVLSGLDVLSPESVTPTVVGKPEASA